MEKRLTQISKFLSLVLRHKPQSIGLTLDAEGWAEIDALIANAEMPLTRAQIDALVETNDKKRFAISSDGRLIRAVQGHSIEVDLGLAPVAPPDTLFHGMATTTRDAILREGLRPMGRRYVHLSAEPGRARAVGSRHGPLVLLLVDAAGLTQAGQPFYQAQNGALLTDAVPPAFLRLKEG